MAVTCHLLIISDVAFTADLCARKECSQDNASVADVGVWHSTLVEFGAVLIDVNMLFKDPLLYLFKSKGPNL